MPVPSSYNDITTSEELRDYVGFIWYQRSFFVPASWSDKRVFIRFGSINYSAQIVSTQTIEFITLKQLFCTFCKMNNNHLIQNNLKLRKL